MLLYTLEVPATALGPPARYELHQIEEGGEAGMAYVTCSLTCGRDGLPRTFTVAVIEELNNAAFLHFQSKLGVEAVGDVARCVLAYKRSKIGTGVSRG